MTRARVLREIRRMRLEEACGGWPARRLAQEAAVPMPGGMFERSGATWSAAGTRGWKDGSTSG